MTTIDVQIYDHEGYPVGDHDNATVRASGIFVKREDYERLMAERNQLLEAGRRSLSWLSSYPGGGALNCYDEMRRATDPYTPGNRQ